LEASVLYEEIGSGIKAARVKAGLSQEVLGDKVGLTRASISNLEAGRQKVPVHTLYEIASTLAVEIHDLLPTHLPSDGYEDQVEVWRSKFVGTTAAR
jgi:transcriptional regulator with XRE-family HTH domain